MANELQWEKFFKISNDEKSATDCEQPINTETTCESNELKLLSDSCPLGRVITQPEKKTKKHHKVKRKTKSTKTMHRYKQSKRVVYRRKSSGPRKIRRRRYVAPTLRRSKYSGPSSSKKEFI